MQLGTIAHKATKINTILAVVISIFALYGGAASIGLNVPRWAWISELKAAELTIDELRLRTEQLNLNMLRSSRSDVISRIAELEAKNIPVPQSFKTQLDDINEDISIQKQFIRKLREKR